MEYTIDHNNNKCTYLNSKVHSYNDLPAIIDEVGNQIWCKDGNFHRDNDLPAKVVCSGRSMEWYQYGEQHRDDGPAVQTIVFNLYYKRGKFHNANGPALEWLYLD